MDTDAPYSPPSSASSESTISTRRPPPPPPPPAPASPRERRRAAGPPGRGATAAAAAASAGRRRQRHRRRRRRRRRDADRRPARLGRRRRDRRCRRLAAARRRPLADAAGPRRLSSPTAGRRSAESPTLLSRRCVVGRRSRHARARLPPRPFASAAERSVPGTAGLHHDLPPPGKTARLMASITSVRPAPPPPAGGYARRSRASLGGDGRRPRRRLNSDGRGCAVDGAARGGPRITGAAELHPIDESDRAVEKSAPEILRHGSARRRSCRNSLE